MFTLLKSDTVGFNSAVVQVTVQTVWHCMFTDSGFHVLFTFCRSVDKSALKNEANAGTINILYVILKYASDFELSYHFTMSLNTNWSIGDRNVITWYNCMKMCLIMFYKHCVEFFHYFWEICHCMWWLVICIFNIYISGTF